MQQSFPRAVPFTLLFELGMWWRIFYGLVRIAFGATLLRLNGEPLSELVYALMSHEITGRTSDAVLGKIHLLFAHYDFTITYFIAGYFIFWGAIEIVLSLCLLRKILFAFPITMALIVIFICYAIFRFTHTHSLILLFIIFIDLGILYVINHEYRRLRGRLL